MTNLEIIELFLIHFYGWEVRDEYLRELKGHIYFKSLGYFEKLKRIDELALNLSFQSSFPFVDTEKGHDFWYKKYKVFIDFIEFTNLKNIQNEISYKDFFRCLIDFKIEIINNLVNKEKII